MLHLSRIVKLNMLILIASSLQLSIAKPVIKVGDVSITGLIEQNGVLSYRGIPFAKAPIGDLRFEHARETLTLAHDIDATKFPAVCPQDQGNVNWYRMVARAVGANPDKIPPIENVSEDCLYLNIWKPAQVDEKLPVMVWIYGGGNVNGYSHEPNYRGHNLATKDVVVVSVQYRLGNLGFLPVPFDHSSVNWGISDLVASLKWIQKHISAFGGDPDSITLFGESAGGGNIATLMLTPTAKGLFHKAIIQSGAIGPKATIDIDIAMDVASKSYADAGIKSLERARDADWSTLLELPAESTYSYYHYPVSDADYTNAQPNWISDVPMLIGANKNEDLMYLFGDPVQGIERSLADKTNAEEIRAALKNLSGDLNLQLDFLGSMSGYFCPALDIAESLESDSYIYNFTRVRPGAKKIGAYHGAEIPYIFNTHDDWLQSDEMDILLTDAMMDYWVNFARTGNPNGPGRQVWEKYTNEKPYIQELGDRTAQSDRGLDAFCALLKD